MKFRPVALTSLFFIWFVVYLFIIFWIPAFRHLDRHSAFGIPLILTSMFLYVLLCLAYVAECTVIQHESPSATIMKLVSQASDGKLPYHDLKKAFSNEQLILSRLDDLVANGYLVFERSRYVFLPKGVVITKIIRSYRKLIRRELGG